nr:putative reverse transcriptase domain-containing protein [Tanacetum cinerariifolium]
TPQTQYSAAGQFGGVTEKIIAQRVTNAIEAITIYEAKTRVTRDSMDQVARQGEKELRMLKTKGNGKMVMTENLVSNKENNKRLRKLALLDQITREVMPENCRPATIVNYITLTHAMLSAKSVKRLVIMRKTVELGPLLQKELNMHQRRSIELLSYYEHEIKYHPGKANVVADTLSRKERLKLRRVHAMSMTIHFGLKTKILEAQGEASKDLKAPTECIRGLEIHFERRDDGEIYFFDRIWIPLVGGVRKLIMDEAHTSRYSVHPGVDKMYYDLRDISGYDAIWVIVDRLTKSAHFLPIREGYKTEKLARIYINEIVARHGVPVSIISDRDGRFASHLWKALQKTLGTKLNMSTAYHPETDDQSERTIQTFKDMLRACVMYFGGSYDTHLPLVKFSYNNSFHKSIKCTPFEALYGRKCRSLVIWVEVGESQLIRPEIMQETTEKNIHNKEGLKTARSCQKNYKGKLAPRYVGQFEIVECVGPVAYRLRLLQELSCVHDVFHVSNLKKCLAVSDLQVPLEEIKVDDKLYFVEEPVKIVDRQVKKLKQSWIPIVKVRWDSRRGAEFT